MNARIKLSLCLLLMSCLSAQVSAADAPSTPVLPGERFGSAYVSFPGTPGTMTAQQYVTTFAAAFQTPDAYAQWIKAGTDIRKLNPSGVYAKHINLRTIVSGSVDPSHPDYNYVVQKHPEWILKDRNGNWVRLFGGNNIALDFGNDAYLDWVLFTWIPNQFLDATDSDPNRVTWYVHDNGNFDRMFIDSNDPVAARYNTDEGVRTAWENLLKRWKCRWPNKRLLISTGPVTYKPVADQLAVFKRILSLSDGYFNESLTNDHSYWNSQPNEGKRTALQATMQLADWLADNGKVFYPNLGMGDGGQPTQAEVDYGFAFFNLVRRGDKQFFSQVTKDLSGNWQPRTYPEMNLPLGEPLEDRQQISPNVYRRSFEHAIAYVNLSDSVVSISLPPGTHTNSLGQAVVSPLTLASFSGLTVYHSMARAPRNLRRAP